MLSVSVCVFFFVGISVGVGSDKSFTVICVCWHFDRRRHMRVSHVLAMYPLATPCYPATTRHDSPGTSNTYPLTQEPLSYYLLQGFSLLLACGKVFNIWRELPVASCALPVANRVANEPHDTFISIFIFIFHLPQHKENFYTFLLKFFCRSQRFTNLFPAQATMTTTRTRTTTRVTAVSWALPKYWQLSCVICKSLCRRLNASKWDKRVNNLSQRVVVGVFPLWRGREIEWDFKWLNFCYTNYRL